MTALHLLPIPVKWQYYTAIMSESCRFFASPMRGGIERYWLPSLSTLLNDSGESCTFKYGSYWGIFRHSLVSLVPCVCITVICTLQTWCVNSSFWKKSLGHLGTIHLLWINWQFLLLTAGRARLFLSSFKYGFRSLFSSRSSELILYYYLFKTLWKYSGKEAKRGKFDFDHHFAFFKTLFKGKNFAVRRVREG